MNMFRTRCMLFYIAKTIGFCEQRKQFSFLSTLFLRTFQQPNPFCCNRSTTSLSKFLSQQNTGLFSFFLSL